MDDFRQRLRDLIKVLGLRQNAFAARLGISPSHVGKLKVGSEPSPLLLTAICCVFSVNRHWLEYGEGKMFAGGLSDPYLEAKQESELIASYKRQITDLNAEIDRLREVMQKAVARADKAEREFDNIKKGENIFDYLEADVVAEQDHEPYGKRPAPRKPRAKGDGK